MTAILVPCHHDERLGDDDIPVRAAVTVTPEFPAGSRLRTRASRPSATGWCGLSPLSSDGCRE
ncbi:hypothetical protein ACTOB_005295 [Actinoplanes oblitus]|uniref:Uncharacterized protein n=1 Tax=Actinoplanes oblitus TaxID=3040509 RepID=A0ABY8W8E4_9ACTN|nr:hypothetical protein [Actinoplanes oblitus]WIM93318.1 hypothetical protein ACTOB_005295 [Actinoplanes oblitus]